MEKRNIAKGTMPAPVPPLCSDRVSLSSAALGKLIELHCSKGAGGFYISGDTEEGLEY